MVEFADPSRETSDQVEGIPPPPFLGGCARCYRPGISAWAWFGSRLASGGDWCRWLGRRCSLDRDPPAARCPELGILRGPRPAHRARFQGRALPESPGQEPDLPLAAEGGRHHGPRDQRRPLPQPSVYSGALPHHGLLHRGDPPRDGRPHRRASTSSCPASSSASSYSPSGSTTVLSTRPPTPREGDLRPAQRRPGRRPRGHRDGQGQPRRGSRDQALRRGGGGPARPLHTHREDTGQVLAPPRLRHLLGPRLPPRPAPMEGWADHPGPGRQLHAPVQRAALRDLHLALVLQPLPDGALERGPRPRDHQRQERPRREPGRPRGPRRGSPSSSAT